MCKRDQSHTDRCRNLLLWHVLTAFLLNSVDWTLFHMPAWFVVSVLGTVVIAIIGVFWLLRFVFVDFSYEEDAEDEQ